MLRLRPTRKATDTIHALHLGEAGAAYASVSRLPGGAPLLEKCEFFPNTPQRDISSILTELSRRHRLDRARCSLLLSEEDYSLLLVEAPQVPPHEIRSAVRWKIQDLIDYHVDDAVLDVFDLPAQPGRSSPTMMYVVASRLDRLRQCSELLQDCGWSLQTIDVQELASRNLAAQLPEDRAGVVLVRLERGRGLITVTRQEQLFLARRLDVGYSELGVADSLDDAPVFVPNPDALDAFIDRLLIEVQRSLDYFESNFREPPIENLAIAPMPVMVEAMPDDMARRSGLRVRYLDLAQVMDFGTKVRPDAAVVCLPAIAAALRQEEVSL